MDPKVFGSYQGFVLQIAQAVDPEAFQASSTDDGSGAGAPAPSAGSNVRFGL